MSEMNLPEEMAAASDSHYRCAVGLDMGQE
jgi:hypothetical protein